MEIIQNTFSNYCGNSSLVLSSKMLILHLVFSASNIPDPTYTLYFQITSFTN